MDFQKQQGGSFLIPEPVYDLPNGQDKENAGYLDEGRSAVIRNNNFVGEKYRGQLVTIYQEFHKFSQLHRRKQAYF